MLTQKFLKTLNFDDTTVSRFQDNVQAIVNPLAGVIISDGNWIQNQVVDSTKNTIQIAHQLGRSPNGYFCTGKNGPLDTWDLPADQTNPTMYLILRFSGTATLADFWVF